MSKGSTYNLFRKPSSKPWIYAAKSRLSNGFFFVHLIRCIKKNLPLLTLDNWHYLKLVYNNDQTFSIDRPKKSWFESRA